MINLLEKLAPAPLLRLDRRLLRRWPRVWLTKIHLIVPLGVVACVPAYFAGLVRSPKTGVPNGFETQKLPLYPDGTAGFLVLTLVCACIALYWIYLQVRDRGVFQVSEVGCEGRLLLAYGACLCVLAAVPMAYCEALYASIGDALKTRPAVWVGGSKWQADELGWRSICLAGQSGEAVTFALAVALAALVRAWQVIRLGALASALGVIAGAACLSAWIGDGSAITGWNVVWALYVVVPLLAFERLRRRPSTWGARTLLGIAWLGCVALPVLFFSWGDDYSNGRGGALEDLWRALYRHGDEDRRVALAMLWSIGLSAPLAFLFRPAFDRVRCTPA